MEFTRQGLTAGGFSGFITVRELYAGKINDLPKSPGVYVVLREAAALPTYLERNPSGHWKGKDPTVSPTELASRWVATAQTIYIGSLDTLQTKLRHYIEFGRGGEIAYWNGRLVWQVEGALEFVVAWRECATLVVALEVQSALLREFYSAYGKLPFANLRF